MTHLDALIASGPKVLVIDIETSPNLAHVWGLWNQNVGLSQIAKVSTVICWAAKWHGEKSVEFRSDHHDGHDAMIKRAHELLCEADVVVGWNSKAFDVKHLRREFVLAGLAPPTPHKDVDLLLVSRRQFKFVSNKLDHVAQQMGLGSKVKHAGFELWLGCMQGDEKSWATMRRYNIGDVKLTERVLDAWLPWVAPFPNQGLYGGPRAGCPRCGSMHMKQEGFRTTSTGKFPLWRCDDCKGLHSGTHRVEAVHQVAL